MRIGTNPAKEENVLNAASYYHRIIVPVYIPNLEGYFKDSLKILELCLASIIQTKNASTALTIVDNNCCSEVKTYLTALHFEGKIESLVLNTENLGKVEAIMQAVRGSHEPLISISDCDVMFLPGWQFNVENIFLNFRHAGFVSPAPSPLSFSYGTAAVFFNELFKGRIAFRESKDPKGVLELASSIEQLQWLNENHRKYFISLKNGRDFYAVLGAGHFVATIKRQIMEFAPKEKCAFKILGNSEKKYIDEPVERSGLYKLSTTEVYALHLGNTLEDWMPGKLAEKTSPENVDRNALLNVLQNSSKPFLLKMVPSYFVNLFYRLIMNKKYSRGLLYRLLGKKFTVNEY